MSKTRRINWRSGDRPIRGYVATDLPANAIKAVRSAAKDMAELDSNGVSMACQRIVRDYDYGRLMLMRFDGQTQETIAGELTIDGYRFRLRSMRDGAIWHRVESLLWLETA